MEPKNHGRRPRNKGRKYLLVMLILIALTTLLGIKWLLPTHPVFGGIREAIACDLNEARDDRLAVFLRAHLPARIVQSPNFPERFKDQPRYLQLGEHQMEWSLGPASGWLYFWGISANRGHINGEWEFATCAETNLASVMTVPSVFYSYTNSQVETAFGLGSTTNALNVSPGQILFARRSQEPKTIFVIKLQEQKGNTLVIRYCVAEQKLNTP